MELKTYFRPSIFSQVSHELRIPLTGILGMIHFLNKTPLNAEQKEYVESIRISAEKLGELEAKMYDLLKNHLMDDHH